MSQKSSSKDLASSLSTSLRKGVEIIFSYVKNLPGKPGVYRMLGKDETVLYVGKAKDLKKRVQSYTLPQRLPNRLQRMISETLSMEFMITRTEIEALLLEANLIKNLSPRYNILLKDSKDYAYLLITDDLWPQLTKHRGAKTRPGQYFGPFASTDAVNNTLTILHRIFRLRSCNNSFFASRKRPCLQYHIKRCSAPCVNYVEEKDYQFAVKKTIDFLQGKSHEVQKELSQKMLSASQEKDYEKAIIYRDQIRAITQIQLRQNLNPTFTTDTDIIAAYSKEGHVCVQVFFYRKGTSYGSKAFFPERTKDMPLEEVVSSFLTVFYEDTPPPTQIFLSHKIQEPFLIEKAMKQKYKRELKIIFPQKGEKRNLIERALENAQEALTRHLSESATQKEIFQHLAFLVGLSQAPQRIEVYDNSHIQGTSALGAMIVVGTDGFEKKFYRKFTIRTAGKGGITPGDDYGMMREVLTRRFKGSLVHKEENTIPDLIIVDGGKGQLNTALDVLHELNLEIPVLAISKGPDRHAGKETFHLKGHPSFNLEHDKKLLYFLQRVRDEAHRFAIGSHRSKREKNLKSSPLDEIQGIGSKRKKILLRHFGSTRNIMNAEITDLQKIEGVSSALAKKIYDFFHP